MPPVIPGFHYDEEKKKYFRIQRNHVVPKTSNAYTHETVKAVNNQQQAQVQQRQQVRKIQVGHVRRSPLTSILSYKLLEYRIRGINSVQGFMALTFSKSLSSRSAYGSSRERKPLHQKFPAPTFDISDDGCMTTIFQHPRRHIGRDWPSSTDDPASFAYNVSDMTTCQHLEGMARDPHNIQIITGCRLPGQFSMVASDGSSLWACFDLNRHRDILREPTNPLTTIWDVAVSPWDGMIATATEDGLRLSDGDTGFFSQPIASGPARNQAQMTVSIRDRVIVISGGRAGGVNFCDVRSRDSVMRLQHSSAVLGIQPTKNLELLTVHGFSTTCIYDLRYSKAVPPYSTHPNRRSGHQHHHSQHNPHAQILPDNNQPYSPSAAASISKNNAVTKPYLDFSVPPSRYTEFYSYGRKIAYSADLNLVIAASANYTSNHQNAVSLYSAETGKLLPGPLSNHRFESPVTCVDMKRLRDGPESIVTLSRGEMLEWTIHHSRQDDEFFYRGQDGTLDLATSSYGSSEYEVLGKNAGTATTTTAATNSVIATAVANAGRGTSFARKWNEGNWRLLGYDRFAY